MKRLLGVLAAQCALMLALGVGTAFANGSPSPQNPPGGDRPSSVTRGGEHGDGRHRWHRYRWVPAATQTAAISSH